MNIKRLMLGAGLTAALFGGATPLALANPVTPDVGACSSSDKPTGAPISGEGIVVAMATDNETGISCSYTSRGVARTTFALAGASAYTISVNGVVQYTNNGAAAGGAPAASGPLTVLKGDVVTLSVASACDPSGQGCGANIQGLIGGS